MAPNRGFLYITLTNLELVPTMKIVKPLALLGHENILPNVVLKTIPAGKTQPVDAARITTIPERESSISVFTSIFDLSRASDKSYYVVIRKFGESRLYVREEIRTERFTLNEKPHVRIIGFRSLIEEGFLLLDGSFYRFNAQDVYNRYICLDNNGIEIDFKQLRKDIRNEIKQRNRAAASSNATDAAGNPGNQAHAVGNSGTSDREILEEANMALEYQIESLHYLADC